MFLGKMFSKLFSGASSNLIVLDIGRNPGNLKVGDLVEFRPDYMGKNIIIITEVYCFWLIQVN